MLPGVLTLPDSSQTSSYNRAGVSGLRTPRIAWCFLAWSSASCQLRTWRGNREENGTGDDAAHVAPWSCSTAALVLWPVLQALLVHQQHFSTLTPAVAGGAGRLWVLELSTEFLPF